MARGAGWFSPKGFGRHWQKGGHKCGEKAFAIIMPGIVDYCKEFAIAISKDPRYD
jgi:hypothetical protein